MPKHDLVAANGDELARLEPGGSVHLEAGRYVVEGVHGGNAKAYVAICGIPALQRLL